MSDPKAPQGGDLSMEQLYGQSPVDVPLNEIYATPGMPYYKETAAEFQPLLQSVRTMGIQQPIRLIPREAGGYYLLSGYRRCHAAIATHMRTIPAIIENKTLEQVYNERSGASAPMTDIAKLHRFPRTTPPVPPRQKKPKRIIAVIKEMFYNRSRHER